MAFEMLKSSTIEKIEGFFTNGFDENGMIVSPEYKEKVLSLRGLSRIKSCLGGMRSTAVWGFSILSLLENCGKDQYV